jgi:glucose dehydrogenase
LTESRVAIVGSGIVGSAVAYLLTKNGIKVDVFEKGDDYPYPHTHQYAQEFLFRHLSNQYSLPKDIKNLTAKGDYVHNLNEERYMRVGGSATRWWAITPRVMPNEFKTKSLYGYGADWPISYDDLEPYYCKAEYYLGCSGTTEDNPFAPRRSQPYPLPAFELGPHELKFAEKLRQRDIVIHTTPQARTRQPYDERPACANFALCSKHVR